MNGQMPPSYRPYTPLPPYQSPQLPYYPPNFEAPLPEPEKTSFFRVLFQKKHVLPVFGILSWLGYFLFLQSMGSGLSSVSLATIAIPSWGAVLLSFAVLLMVLLCFTGFIAITFVWALPQDVKTKTIYGYALIITAIALWFWGYSEGINYLIAMLLFGGTLRIWFQTHKIKEKFVRVETGMMLPKIVGEFMVIMAIMLGIMAFSIVQNVTKDGTDAPIVQTARTKLGLVGALVAFGSFASIDETTTVGQLSEHLANPQENKEQTSSTTYPILNFFQPITTALITDAGAFAQKGISSGIIRTFGRGTADESTPLSTMMGSYLLDGIFSKFSSIFQGISLLTGIFIFLVIKYIAGWISVIVSLLVPCITFFCRKLGIFETKQETRVVERMAWS